MQSRAINIAPVDSNLNDTKLARTDSVFAFLDEKIGKTADLVDCSFIILGSAGGWVIFLSVIQ